MILWVKLIYSEGDKRSETIKIKAVNTIEALKEIISKIPENREISVIHIKHKV